MNKHFGFRHGERVEHTMRGFWLCDHEVESRYRHLASPERAIDVSEFPEKLLRVDQVRPRVEFAMRLH
jgi:hypothetical protein